MRKASVSKIPKSKDCFTKTLISKLSRVHFVIRDITIFSTLSLVLFGRYIEHHTCQTLSGFQLPVHFWFIFPATEVKNWLNSWHSSTVTFGFDRDFFPVRRLNFEKNIYYLICFWQQLVFENVIVSFGRQFSLAVFLQRTNAPNFPVNSQFVLFIQKMFSVRRIFDLGVKPFFCPGVLIFSGINLFTISWVFKLKCSKH